MSQSTINNRNRDLTEDRVYEMGELKGFGDEIMRRAESVEDFTVDTGSYRTFGMTDATNALRLKIDGEEAIYPATPHCHGQIASKLKIPRQYYDRMRLEAPELLAANVNHWFVTNPERRLIRTLDGQARAVMSDRYRPLDNFDLMKAVSPVLRDSDMQVKECALTETRMYLKAVFPKLESEVKKGDIVQAGLILSNSEVGAGSVKIEAMIWRLVCLNGLITGTALRKFHVGRQSGSEEDIQRFLRDETREADDKAFFMKVHDIVQASVNEDVFEENVDILREAAGSPKIKAPQAAIERFDERFRVTDEERDAVFGCLVDGGDLTRYGLTNAVTAAAKHSKYDRRIELERLANDVLNMSEKSWLDDFVNAK